MKKELEILMKQQDTLHQQIIALKLTNDTLPIRDKKTDETIRNLKRQKLGIEEKIRRIGREEE